MTCLTQALQKTTGCLYCSHKEPRPYRRKRPYEVLYNNLRNRGRHPVLLTYDQFVALTEQKECHYCGTGITWSRHRLKGETTASNLDRKDNGRPYEQDNVVVCCIRCNKGKNTHFTYDEWKAIGAVIRSWREREKAA